MNSSFLCVIVIGLFQVFAEARYHSRYHSRLRQKYLPQINEESEDKFHSELWRMNLRKINEEKKKRNAGQFFDYIGSDNFISGHRFHTRAEKTKAYLVCAEKTGVSPDMILRIKKGDWTNGSQKIKSWIQCVLMESKLMTDQSVFRLDVAFKNLSTSEKETLEANVDKCLPKKALPPREISWRFAQCFQAADPENSLF